MHTYTHTHSHQEEDHVQQIRVHLRVLHRLGVCGHRVVRTGREVRGKSDCGAILMHCTLCICIFFSPFTLYIHSLIHTHTHTHTGARRRFLVHSHLARAVLSVGDWLRRGYGLPMAPHQETAAFAGGGAVGTRVCMYLCAVYVCVVSNVYVGNHMWACE
jgi:hypothetical protein